jgi:fatty acid desaturase
VRGASSLIATWAIIAGAMTLVAVVPHPLTVAVALVLIGGRQLGLAVLMHEASHRSLFRTRWLNDAVGRWLCGAPMWTHLDAYRKHHLGHHAYTNTDRDPDLNLVAPFPVSRRSLARKLLRDVTGLTGLKRVIGLTLMDLGFLTYSASGAPQRGAKMGAGERLRHAARRLGPVLVTNGAMLGILFAVGQTWLYLLWVGAYLSVFSLFLRIRSLAEHACTEPVDSPDARDPLRNTRTTRAGLLARLTVAPHHVNYHLEHHLLMTVPHYKLPRMHRMLVERGALGDGQVPSYVDVLRLVGNG